MSATSPGIVTKQRPDSWQRKVQASASLKQRFQSRSLARLARIDNVFQDRSLLSVGANVTRSIVDVVTLEGALVELVLLDGLDFVGQEEFRTSREVLDVVLQKVRRRECLTADRRLTTGH